MDKPFISISCITYNHGKYIRECLDGFLMQKTNFAFEILIHDDASTDNTAEIIRDYQEKYPKLLKPIFQTQNQYSKGQRGINMRYNFPRARGKYIALCEGDDYWTDPYKLQKQVDFLEKEQQFVAHFHNAWVKNSISGESYPYHNWECAREVSNFELLRLGGYSYPTASIIFRNSKQEWPNFKHSAGDMELLISLVKSGKFYYSSEIMSVYRRHEDGVYSGSKKKKKEILRSENLVIKSLEEKKEILNSEIYKGVEEYIRLKVRQLLINYGFEKNIFFKGVKYFNLFTTFKLIIFHEKNRRG